VSTQTVGNFPAHGSEVLETQDEDLTNTRADELDDTDGTSASLDHLVEEVGTWIPLRPEQLDVDGPSRNTRDTDDARVAPFHAAAELRPQTDYIAEDTQSITTYDDHDAGFEKQRAQPESVKNRITVEEYLCSLGCGRYFTNLKNCRRHEKYSCSFAGATMSNKPTRFVCHTEYLSADRSEIDEGNRSTVINVGNLLHAWIPS
jgi:hypothetical protein